MALTLKLLTTESPTKPGAHPVDSNAVLVVAHVRVDALGSNKDVVEPVGSSLRGKT